MIWLSGCGTIERSPESGYSQRGTPGLGRESGEKRSRLSFSDQPDPAALRAAVARAEKALEGRREREQYFKNRPYMKNDRERLEFLRLETFDERARWLAARGIQGSSTKHPLEIQDLIDNNDITVGMTRQAVRDSWGEPEAIEVAGNPLYGNERWSYSEQIPSTEGFHSERRTVMFEAGRVIGWETK
jgi:hypothetical protein